MTDIFVMTVCRTARTTLLGLIAAAVIAAPPLIAEPLDLMDTFRLAESQDPRLRAAEDRFRGTEETRAQARALFLPELNLEAESAYNWDSTRFGGQSRRNTDYESWNAGLVARQPLFRIESFSARRQADIVIDTASLEVARAREELALRTSEVYFDILLAQDQLATVEAELVAIERELQRAQRALEVGTGTVTDVNDAQARFDLVQSDRLRAENNLSIARENLRRLIDRPVGELMSLQDDFRADPPEPADAAAWARRAEANNLQVLIAEQGFERAREEVEQERGSRYPQVDMVARHGRSYQGEVTGGGGGAAAGQQFGGALRSEQTSIGLQLTMPLYTGGATSSRIRERQAERDATFSDTLDAKRSAAIDAESTYLNLVSNLRQIEALEQALRSIRSTEQSTQRGIEVGLRTTLDLLNVQRERFETERQLSEARYSYLLNYLRLLAAVGAAADDTGIQDVNFFLTRDPGPRDIPDPAELDALDEPTPNPETDPVSDNG
ncbi:TolC family outer membrane protein [Methylonatrum kenyense]|uniref:TolC family outer membrane protein n=1 Tax=Methylonatrum kenyense TaxID=455253 RepID=UPI0020BDB10A|nr:TolC family outer membrane protein [Methylonatrum kenyense]MCK8517263.1 TolC family outer membrane protein [Methylonatrum kenyense]